MTVIFFSFVILVNLKMEDFTNADFLSFLVLKTFRRNQNNVPNQIIVVYEGRFIKETDRFSITRRVLTFKAGNKHFGDL